MSIVGQIEKHTQARIVALLRDRLHYAYLGNWIDRADNQYRSCARPVLASQAGCDRTVGQPRTA